MLLVTRMRGTSPLIWLGAVMMLPLPQGTADEIKGNPPPGTSISLVPTGNGPNGNLDSGTRIDGNEIIMERGGATVFLDIRISNWDPDDLGTLLSSYLVQIDSSGYVSGLDGTLSAKLLGCHGRCAGGRNDGQACNTSASCNTCNGGPNDGLACVESADCAPGVCAGTCDTTANPEGDPACRLAYGAAFCTESGESCLVDSDCPLAPSEQCSGSTCGFPVGSSFYCFPAFIGAGRPDYVFRGTDSAPLVDTATKDYRYASSVLGGAAAAPDPFPEGGLHAGTLVLEVGPDARGTFSVGLIPFPRTLLIDGDNGLIVPELHAATITITVGVCCYDLGDSVTCIDQVTVDECNALPSPRRFFAAESCPDVPDGCSVDCNANLIPDILDTLDGTSADCDGNGVLDECDNVCLGSDAPQQSAAVVATNRYLSFDARNDGCFTALRVIPVDLPQGFESFTDVPMWVTGLHSVCQNPRSTEPPCSQATGFSNPELWTATLGCAPEYRDWGAVGLLHVSDDIIVPGGSYSVQVVNRTCEASLEGSFSAPLVVSTSRWGDIGGPFDPTTGRWAAPDDRVDVVFDAVAILGKFANEAGAPSKQRADIQPAVPDRIIDILDVVFVIDAFRGSTYPFEPVSAPCQ